jgi:hypothetical protein
MKSAVRVAVVSLLVAGCGGETASRMDLRTPGADTGHAGGTFPLVNPTPTPTATPTATPRPEGGPVTSEEKRVIRGWSRELRAGHVAAAARYFTVPAVVSNAGGEALLASHADARAFNKALPCGAKLVRTRRAANHFVIGTFQLTRRPGANCGGDAGHLAEFAFRIQRHRITQWVRGPDPEPDPSKAPKPPPADRT